MHINNTVVRALIELRRLDLNTLAQLAHVTRENMQRWVLQGDEDAMTFEQQLEVLSYLGIRGEDPRADVVHFWHVHEPLLGRASKTYAPLQVVLEAFGPAEVVHLNREREHALALTAQAYFGLKFQSFLAILSVTASALRSISFDPDSMAHLAWAPGAAGVALPSLEYDRLEPGSMPVRALGGHIAQAGEAAAWEQLRLTAQTQGLRADQVAHLLNEGLVSADARLEMSEPAQTVAPSVVQPAPEAVPVASAPAPEEHRPAPPASVTPLSAARRPMVRGFSGPGRGQRARGGARG